MRNRAIGGADFCLSAFQGYATFFLRNPGRRFATYRRSALPWAMSLLPHLGRIAFLLQDKRGFLGHDVPAHSGRIAAVAERP